MNRSSRAGLKEVDPIRSILLSVGSVALMLFLGSKGSCICTRRLAGAGGAVELAAPAPACADAELDTGSIEKE